MEKDVITRNLILKIVIGAGILYLFAAVALILCSIFIKPVINVEEKIPEVVSITNAPELQVYVKEFSLRHREEIVAMSDRLEPEVPVDHKMIQGKMIFADHNTNYSMWAIQSYLGKDWLEGQKFYLYSDDAKELEEVVAFTNKQIYSPVILSTGNSNGVFVLVPVWTKDKNGYYSHWAHELWAYQIKTKEARRFTIGEWVDVSPDRSKVAFWRSSKDNFWKAGSGFHCLYLWDVKTDQIEPVISMWESDPGSGRSWDFRWSDDSEAMSITGSCGGFARHGQSKRVELNLIYSVRGKKFYSVK